MKLLFLILTIIPFFISAQQVSVDEAQNVAEQIFSQKVLKQNKIKFKDISVELSTTVYNESNNALFYIFNVSDKGFIIISANKNSVPLLAYSTETTFYGSIPPAVDFWLNRYKEQINYLYDNNVKNINNQEKWDRILNGKYNSKDDVYIAPMVNSKWNQGKYYNDSCPSDGNGPNGHAYTGCVATAMGQILYYHRFPRSGTGSYSYDCPNYGTLSADFASANYNYEEMPFELIDYSPSTALLLYHLGVSFDMQYGPNSSGVTNHSVGRALRQYFKMCPETKYVFRDSTTMNWDSIVVANLSVNKPLYYAGWVDDTSYTSGHAFVCDGYDGADYYHFNFGWGGAYDGWFYSDNIAPGGNQFTYAQEVVKDIYPDTVNYNYPEYCNELTNINYSAGSLSDGSGALNYEKNADCSWVINPDCGLFIDVFIDELDLADGDTLFLYSGDKENNSLITYFTKDSVPRFSWQSNSDVYTAGNGSLYVNFKSDDNLEAKGWKISYYSSHCKYGYTITDTAGIISDGSEDCDYEPSTYCRWTISPPDAEAIEINFTEFDLADGYDNVKIFKDYSSSSTLFAEFKKDNPPTEPFVVPAGTVVIAFATTGTAQGWKLKYKTTTLDVINESRAVTNFSVYPNPVGLYFYIESKENILIKTVSIFDITGKQVKNISINNIKAKIDVSDLDKGIYLIKFNGATEKIVVRY